VTLHEDGVSPNPGASTARELAAQLLARAYEGRVYVDLLLSAHLRRVEDARERKLLTELVRGTVRWKGYLSWIARKHYRGDYLRVPADVRAAIEMGIYQLLFLTHVPSFAAVDEAVEIVKRRRGQTWANRANAVLRAIQRTPREALEPASPDLAQRLAIRWSHPTWMVARWLTRFGESDTLALLKANNEPAPLTVRVKPAGLKPAELVQSLKARGIHAEELPGFPGYLVLSELPEPLPMLDEFVSGLITPQDASAQLVVRLLAPRSGERVWDVCAAPGGKATAIAEEIGIDGCVFASDIHPARLRLVREQQRRLRLGNMLLLVADATALPFARMTKVLIDAPCSGTGVLRRRVDLRWQRKPEQIRELADLQLRMLQSVARLQMPGDVLVYATCTLEMEENEDVVARFLSETPQYVLDPADKYVPSEYCTSNGFVRTFPHRHGLDGVFAARLIRT